MAEHKADRGPFWRDVVERVVRAFAQGMLAGLAVGFETFDKGGLPWLDSFYIGVGCAVIGLLLSLAGRKVGDPRNGSLLGKKPLAPVYEQPPPTPDGTPPEPKEDG